MNIEYYKNFIACEMYEPLEIVEGNINFKIRIAVNLIKLNQS